MNKDVTSLIEESINLELNVCDIYSFFHKLFPEDAEFWWELVFEEKNHAALIRSGKEYFEPVNKFPHNLLHHSLQNLKDTNSKLLSLIKNFENTPPSREEAFNIAFKIENSAGELHFQKFMDEEANSTTDKIFKQLNKDDKEHAMRIRSYMEKHGISIQSDNGLTGLGTWI
jgi:ferritin